MDFAINAWLNHPDAYPGFSFHLRASPTEFRRLRRTLRFRFLNMLELTGWSLVPYRRFPASRR